MQLALFRSQGQEPTPSAQLGASMQAMAIATQPQHMPVSQDRAPVPLFSQAQLEAMPMSQLGSQAGAPFSQVDFITPVDAQFDLEYDPSNSQANRQRSPAQLSPSRAKRARTDLSDVPGE
jgi:hypothetical protein